ncbi:MAG: OsmC family protein [Porticoccaceae bacterium]|nr:OsmC family protein [Porticoccaceae bacterium]
MATLRIKEIEEANTRTAKSVMAAGGLRCNVEMEGHITVIDEPPERGGTNMGATPLLHMSAALASCQTVQIAKVAESMRLNFGEIKIDATIDTGRGDGREDGARIIRIVGAKMVVSIETDASEKKIERLKRLAVDRCPIGALLDDAGVEPEIIWQILPLTGEQ